MTQHISIIMTQFVFVVGYFLNDDSIFRFKCLFFLNKLNQIMLVRIASLRFN